MKMKARRGPRALLPEEQNELNALNRELGEIIMEILKTLMLRRSMISRIPFRTGPPIINIPPMEIKTTRLTFADDNTRALYRTMVDKYKQLKSVFQDCDDGIDLEDIPEANWGVKALKFGPRWRYIRLISLSPMLGPASFQSSFRGATLWTTPSKELLCTMARLFLEWLPRQFRNNPYLPKSTRYLRELTDTEWLNVLEWGAPKLGHLRDQLRNLVEEQEKKVILWVYWPLSQWLVLMVCCSLIVDYSFSAGNEFYEDV